MPLDTRLGMTCLRHRRTDHVPAVRPISNGESATSTRRILGLALVVDQGTCLIYRASSGDAYVGVCERATPDPGSRASVSSSPSSPTTSTAGAAAIVDRGGVIDIEVRSTTATYAIHHAFLRRPRWERHIEIQRFDDPALGVWTVERGQHPAHRRGVAITRSDSVSCGRLRGWCNWQHAGFWSRY